MRDLCFGCKTFQEVTYTQPVTDRNYCTDCAAMQPITAEDVASFLLLSPNSILGPQYHPGDIVEARTAALIYDGIGMVEEMSMELKNGGTPVYPSFRVRITEKAHDEAPDEAWYTEVCLRKVEQPQEVSND